MLSLGSVHKNEVASVPPILLNNFAYVSCLKNYVALTFYVHINLCKALRTMMLAHLCFFECTSTINIISYHNVLLLNPLKMMELISFPLSGFTCSCIHSMFKVVRKITAFGSRWWIIETIFLQPSEAQCNICVFVWCPIPLNYVLYIFMQGGCCNKRWPYEMHL